VIVLAGLVVAFGALVQGTAGFGLALVAAPAGGRRSPAGSGAGLLVQAALAG
jgi:uncharacterized protein